MFVKFKHPQFLVFQSLARFQIILIIKNYKFMVKKFFIRI